MFKKAKGAYTLSMKNNKVNCYILSLLLSFFKPIYHLRVYSSGQIIHFRLRY